MRILMRVLGVVVLLLVAALVAAALILPGVIDSDEFRERVGVAAEDALGRNVGYGTIGFAFFPPSVVVEQVVVAGESAEKPPLLEGERLELRASLLPLLARTLVVDSLSLRGARLNLVRTDTGIEIPSAKSKGEDAAANEPDDADAGFDLAVARVNLDEVDIVLEDRSVSPAVTWELRGMTAHARGISAAEPVELDFELELASGGKVSGSGDASLAGVVDLEVKFSEVALEPVRAYLGSGSTLAGRLSGTIVAVGPAANLESLRVDAQLSDGRFALDDMEIVGSVKLVADLHGGPAAPRGTFDIDATDAEVRYGGMFTKPPGDAATVQGKLVEGADGSTGIDDIHFKVRNFKGTASVQGGARPRVTVDAPAFDLRGWEALVPALAGYSLSGPVQFEALEMRSEPVEIRGRVVFEGITVVLPDSGPVRLQGALLGTGESIESEDLRLVAADQSISIDASLSDLGRSVRFRALTSANDADANLLATTFASKRDFVFGLLTMNGDFRGALAGARPPLETLAGNARVDIGAGRLVGVSLLKLTFDRFEGLGSLAVLASRVLGGPDLTPFYGDEFLAVHGVFDVVAGLVKTDDLRITYPDYMVDLGGTLRIHDLGIDMQGVITLGERLATTLGRGDLSDEANRIRLARVTGTLDDPNVQVSPEVASAFLGRSGLDQKAGKALGDAVGGEVGDLLEGILGGSLSR